jgi:hypothetical protein
MFDFTSRYYSLDTATLTDANGQVITYVRRRFLPALENLQILATVTVGQGDRLDLISARTLGAPEQFWRLSDANTTMNPLYTTVDVGTVVKVPMPQAPGAK